MGKAALEGAEFFPRKKGDEEGALFPPIKNRRGEGE
jgi:hypothetical protein